MKEVDLLLYNGEIITLEEELREKEENLDFYDTVAVKDGKIVAVGNKKELSALKENAKKVVNLEGKTVVPGFIDAHVHFMQTGLNKLFLDFTTASSREEMLETIR